MSRSSPPPSPNSCARMFGACIGDDAALAVVCAAAAIALLLIVVLLVCLSRRVMRLRRRVYPFDQKVQDRRKRKGKALTEFTQREPLVDGYRSFDQRTDARHEKFVTFAEVVASCSLSSGEEEDVNERYERLVGPANVAISLQSSDDCSDERDVSYNQ